jgi:hypothetical protein
MQTICARRGCRRLDRGTKPGLKSESRAGHGIGCYRLAVTGLISCFLREGWGRYGFGTASRAGEDFFGNQAVLQFFSLDPACRSLVAAATAGVGDRPAHGVRLASQIACPVVSEARFVDEIHGRSGYFYCCISKPRTGSRSNFNALLFSQNVSSAQEIPRNSQL